jgi:hypothetical protein
MGSLLHANGAITITGDSASISLPFADFQLIEPNYHYPELGIPITGCRYESGKSSALQTEAGEIIYPFEESCEYCISQIENYQILYKELIKQRFITFRESLVSPPALQYFEELFNELAAESITQHSILFAAWAKVEDEASLQRAIALWNYFIPELNPSAEIIAAFSSALSALSLELTPGGIIHAL